MKTKLLAQMIRKRLIARNGENSYLADLIKQMSDEELVQRADEFHVSAVNAIANKSVAKAVAVLIVAIGLLFLAASTSAQNHGQPVKSTAPVICVHGQGGWDPNASTLTLIPLGTGCDVATASRTYSWTKDDDADFSGMMVAAANSSTFISDCVRQEMANGNKDCDPSTHDLIAMYLHAAKASRENLCSRHPDWWVVRLSDTGSFENLQSCGD